MTTIMKLKIQIIICTILISKTSDTISVLLETACSESVSVYYINTTYNADIVE